MAGFSKKEVNITANNDVLRINAKKGEKEKTFSIALNDLVRPSEITSKMSNGLLSVVMPKKAIKESVEIEIQ